MESCYCNSTCGGKRKRQCLRIVGAAEAVQQATKHTQNTSQLQAASAEEEKIAIVRAGRTDTAKRKEKDPKEEDEEVRLMLTWPLVQHK